MNLMILNNMKFTSFEKSDLQNLSELQPPDWGDLVPRFEYFLKSSYCQPIKLTENNETIAIGTSMLHEDSVWLACIIVHPNHRKKGLGNIITQKLIDGIDRQKFKSIYLDATDMGYPVYKKLGFEIEAEYVHLKREAPFPIFPTSPNIIPFREELKERILKLDEQISGENRRGILCDFLNQSQIYLDEKNVQGFYIPGWGDGPVIADNTVAGIELLKLRSQNMNSAVVPPDNTTALDFLEKHGFIIYKKSKRMILGQKKPWNADGIFNWISGQLG